MCPAVFGSAHLADKVFTVCFDDATVVVSIQLAHLLKIHKNFISTPIILLILYKERDCLVKRYGMSGIYYGITGNKDEP